MRTLKNFVHVEDPEGKRVVLAPGVPVPDWAVPLITNPAAWAPDTEVPEAEADTSGTDDTGFTPDPGGAGDTGGGKFELPKPPPRSGSGSGRDAWAAYATEHGVDVTEDLKTRDDIIAACELAGIPVK